MGFKKFLYQSVHCSAKVSLLFTISASKSVFLACPCSEEYCKALINLSSFIGLYFKQIQVLRFYMYNTYYAQMLLGHSKYILIGMLLVISKRSLKIT